MGMNRTEKDGWFVVTYVHRDDVATALMDERGWDEDSAISYANGLTDDEMRLIAEHMADTYVGFGSYWFDLAYQSEELQEDEDE